jgi:1-acyl-sn-glycerol-3-phosphate acyltransferase
MPSQLDALTQINLDDLVSSFGWEKQPIPAALIRRIFGQSAGKFARQIIGFDTAIGNIGLTAAARQFLQKYFVHDVHVFGREHIPADGPALILSNHPGLADNISLFAAINRADLKTIAVQRPFLTTLPNTAKHLFLLEDDPAKRITLIRQVSAYLRQGGAALICPAGEIEPDPEVYPGALDSLAKWSDSARVFMRFAPETKIVPVLVSGVIWKKTARHWLTRIKRTRFDRERLAAALQLLTMVAYDARPTTVKIRFAKPIILDDVGTETQAIHQAVIASMRGLIQSPVEGAGVSAL